MLWGGGFRTLNPGERSDAGSMTSTATAANPAQTQSSGETEGLLDIVRYSGTRSYPILPSGTVAAVRGEAMTDTAIRGGVRLSMLAALAFLAGSPSMAR